MCVDASKSVTHAAFDAGKRGLVRTGRVGIDTVTDAEFVVCDDVKRDGLANANRTRPAGRAYETA